MSTTLDDEINQGADDAEAKLVAIAALMRHVEGGETAAAFEPEALELLAWMRREKPATWQTTRDALNIGRRPRAQAMAYAALAAGLPPAAIRCAIASALRAGAEM